MVAVDGGWNLSFWKTRRYKLENKLNISFILKYLKHCHLGSCILHAYTIRSQSNVSLATNNLFYQNKRDYPNFLIWSFQMRIEDFLRKTQRFGVILFTFPIFQICCHFLVINSIVFKSTHFSGSSCKISSICFLP